MANFTITALDTTAEVLNDNEFGFIGVNGELVVSGADAITGSGRNRLSVQGSVTAATVATTSDQVYQFDGTDVDIFVGSAGSMVSFSGDALDLVAANRVELTNAGAIMADFTAVDIDESDGSLNANILNDGLISASFGVTMNLGSGGASLTNTGVINANSLGVRVSTTGVVRLANSGTITGIEGNALDMLGVSGGVSITNTGTLIGIIFLGSGNDLFDGSNGVQSGFIDLHGGNDTFLGGAGAEFVSGSSDEDFLSTGGGNDTILGNFDRANDTMDGGDGVDLADYFATNGALQVDLDAGTASGGSIGFDTLISIENVRTGIGNDTVAGSDDDNFIRTTDGNDLLLGQAGRDRLVGGKDNDTIHGGEGNDRLFGGTENDRLFGGTGNDLLVGGAGLDAMTGDAGNDKFAFLDITDSGTTAGTRDRITDFQQNSDKIDLSAIDADLGTAEDDLFVFIGTSVFSGTAGEVRYRNTASLTLVGVDQDGDGAADLEIRLDGVITLLQGDFIL